MKLSHKGWNGKICALFVVGLIIVLGISWGAFYVLTAPMVSVVMPVYNGAKNNYLHRSINSILNQSFKDFELIMVDDGSSDNSWEILKYYAAKDSRIKLLKNDRNHGISYSRNRGNDVARGKYIMLMDQDDNNHPKRMAKQVAYMEERPWVDIVAVPSDPPFSGFGCFPVQDMLRFNLFIDNNLGHPNLMVKRSFLIKNKIRYSEEYKCANDLDWLIQIRDHGGYFGCMYEVLFYYNGANYSATGRCKIDGRKIFSKYSSYNRKTQRAEYICDVAKMAQRTPKYAKLFTPGFLGLIEEEFCVKGEE